MKTGSKHPLKIIVTGSRGKSSLVRLIHAALLANGSAAYGRITGVLPRELTPDGEIPILRSSGGHVGEIGWWLASLCSRAESVVIENSAVCPECQSLAWKWARPDLTVLTNIHTDHQEAWGPEEEDAAAALSLGVCPGSEVVLGPGLENKDFLTAMLRSRHCIMLLTPVDDGETADFRKINLLTALTACRRLGLDMEPSERAMRGLPADIADFRVVRVGSKELAFAFSANDLASSMSLFDILGWEKPDTVLLYNHRKDRGRRLESFKEWILENPWASVSITGDRPLAPWTWRYFAKHGRLADMLPGLSEGDKIFGCGNVAGLPLEFILGKRD